MVFSKVENKDDKIFYDVIRCPNMEADFKGGIASNEVNNSFSWPVTTYSI